MSDPPETAICRFYRLIPDAPAPEPADRSADGMLPTRAYRYCEAAASASAFGWYIYPPLNFTLAWTGNDTIWTYEGADNSYPVRSVQYPGFLETFEKAAPDAVKALAPPLLTLSREPGVVQVWSGYLAQTAPGWALLSRGPVNVPPNQGYDHFEGIIETETWFGPLFTNIRLTRNAPVEFHKNRPLFQVQPLLRQCYQAPSFEVLGMGDLDAADWQRFEETMRPNTDDMRGLGHYAAATRKRLRGGER
jgi:hypothetical protein